MSLLENIRLGKLDATGEEVIVAAKKTQCSKFLSKLKDRIHTLAGDDGKQLSWSQSAKL